MSFTSINFLLFVFVVVILNYLTPQKWRWVLLLTASYYFYLNWQPIYAILLVVTTIITYVCSLQLYKEKRNNKRKLICIIACVLPLCSLAVFKYYNFITNNVTGVLSYLHLYIEMPKLNLLMPIGISFYTFTSIGYIIDIYRRKYQPETHFGIFALFISFFAQISSGPIPRGEQLIPQLRQPENISYDNIMGGLRAMVWGFFMKLCVANRLGIYVDVIYGNIDHHNGGSLLLAAILYAIQIYCDFAGYSLVAIGVARMLGIELMDNFRRPYFSTSIKEFWSRWHISLSTWFRDYVYIPLGGNRVSKKRNLLNLILTFLVSGLWHGASWNYILWGGLHGTGQSIEKLVQGNKKWESDNNILLKCLKIFAIFIVICLLWVFFRLQTLNEIQVFLCKIFTELDRPFTHISLAAGFVAILILLIKDIIDEFWPSIRIMSSPNIIISNVATGVLVSIILLIGVFDSTSFIYYQF